MNDHYTCEEKKKNFTNKSEMARGKSWKWPTSISVGDRNGEKGRKEDKQCTVMLMLTPSVTAFSAAFLSNS